MLKICGVLRILVKIADTQQGRNVRFQLDDDAIFIDEDAVDHELQVVAVELLLMQDIVEYFKHRFRRAVHADDRVTLVGRQIDLLLQSRDTLCQIIFQLVVGFLEDAFLIGVLDDVTDALALCRFQFFLQFKEDFFEVFRASVSLGDILVLVCEFGVQLFQCVL